MRQYRFSGTVKRIEWKFKGDASVAFVPDMEYSSSYKKEKDVTISFAVFQPVEEKGEGFVILYDKDVVFSHVKDVFHFSCGAHVTLILDKVDAKKADFSLSTTRLRHFTLTSLVMP